MSLALGVLDSLPFPPSSRPAELLPEDPEWAETAASGAALLAKHGIQLVIFTGAV